MSSMIQKLIEKDLIHPPGFIKNSVQYETMMGSIAYGVSEDTSDTDIYSFCIPTKEIVFPHTAGIIQGFGRQQQHFEVWQEHHVLDKEQKKEFDLSCYNIVKFFQLCMECNPNMIDSLFTPRFCVLFSTQVGEMVREERKLFLHKGSYYKFKGYAYSQMSRLKNKENKTGKRKELIEKYSYDVKFGYQVLRLLDEGKQILMTGDLDLQKNREQLKAMRRGEIPEEEFVQIVAAAEKDLESLYISSSLQDRPDEEKIKQLLLRCLEHHYGNLGHILPTVGAERAAIQKIKEIVSEF